MIVILLPPQDHECPCYLCNARRMESEEYVNEQMEDRLRSLVDHKDCP